MSEGSHSKTQLSEREQALRDASSKNPIRQVDFLSLSSPSYLKSEERNIYRRVECKRVQKQKVTMDKEGQESGLEASNMEPASGECQVQRHGTF